MTPDPKLLAALANMLGCSIALKNGSIAGEAVVTTSIFGMPVSFNLKISSSTYSEDHIAVTFPVMGRLAMFAGVENGNNEITQQIGLVHRDKCVTVGAFEKEAHELRYVPADLDDAAAVLKVGMMKRWQRVYSGGGQLPLKDEGWIGVA